jgi:branched-chain amino acid aminotransferase
VDRATVATRRFVANALGDTGDAECARTVEAPEENEMSEPIRIQKTTTKKERPKDKDLTFGTVFTDHMFVVDFEEEKGWYDPRVEPYGTLPLDPATAVLHYGQSLFEGLKAFRGQDGKVRLFRPDKHVARLNRTAQRMCIPTLDPDLILKSWTTLVDVDRAWVPSAVGTSLYIRPTVIASEPFLGVRPAREYLYYVILSPVGPYYPEGLAPTKIKVIDNYVRAVAGGLGEAKTSANYAASLFAAEEAKHEGFTQVLWLDGVEHKYVEEVGTSNIMLRIGDEVITPPLAGTILAGVTRDTALALLRSWGVRVSERAITIDEVVAAADNGTLREVWATGTAAVISPVGELAYQGRRLVVNGGRIGDLAQKLYDTIVAIQYGAAPDPHGWTVVV